MSQQQIIHAYRHLYRASLQAVCYSQPASTVVRDQLRSEFRARDGVFDERAIKRTIWFLKNAAKYSGIEHKIVKNLLFVKFWKKHIGQLDRPAWKALAEGKAPGPKTQYVLVFFFFFSSFSFVLWSCSNPFCGKRGGAEAWGLKC